MSKLITPMPRCNLRHIFTLVLAFSVLTNLILMLLSREARKDLTLTNKDSVNLEAMSMGMKAMDGVHIPPDPVKSPFFVSLLNCVVEALKDNRSTSIDSAEHDTRKELKQEWEERELRDEMQRKDDVISFLSQPVINDFTFGYLINPNHTCDIGKTQLLFVIPSAPENFENRAMVRKGGKARYVKVKGNNAKMLFFLGMPAASSNDSEKTQTRVLEESATHGDIVQLDFEDVYRNILLKAISMLRWASTFCRRTTYVIRTDDDVWIRVAKVRSVLESTSRKHKDFILGDRKDGWAPHRVRESKYYVSEADYPQSTFPPFAVGGLLGYPISTVSLLYQAAVRLEPLWLDDVFITGLCAPKVNVPLVSDPDFKFWHRMW